jgi:DNA invertase Pin-like site-specific DNA recombinase
MAIAYSYLRFSSPQQATGDSIRRQVEKSADWCRRNNVELDSSMSLRDEGVSAYRGKHRENPDTHALAAFVAAVRDGRVPAGSYLLVESLDRLSREKIRPALTLLLNLIEAGIKVVQLLPVEVIYDEDVEPMQLLMAVMELNRGHSESKVKSERVGAAWAKKHREAGEKIVTRRLPGWVRYVAGKLVLDDTKAAVVRRIFAMAIEGMGVHSIAEALNAEGVPTMGRRELKGRAVRWNETVVYHVLKSRATFGQYQPHKGRAGARAPVGYPIDEYYPAAVTKQTYMQAQSALKGRRRHGAGRRGAHVNLFGGLLRDAHDGGTMTYKHLNNRSSSIIPVGAKQGRGSVWSSFPAVPLETALLSGLREVPASEVLGGISAATQVATLVAEKERLESLVHAWEAQMDNVTNVPAIAAKLVQYTSELETVTTDLAEAEREAAGATGESWGEFRSLAEILDRDNSNEMRTRVKAVLRRCVSRVRCAFGHRSRNSIAILRVDFVTGNSREYVVIYSPGRSNGRVKRTGKLFVDSIGLSKNETVSINYDELARRYKEHFIQAGD